MLRAGRLKAGGDGTNLGESSVRVVLRYDAGVTVRDAVVPLQRTDAQGTPLGAVAKGQRGQWSISGWPITRPGHLHAVRLPRRPRSARRHPGPDRLARHGNRGWDSRTFASTVK